MREQLETAHRVGTHALGVICLGIVKRKIRPSEVLWVIEQLEVTIRLLRQAIGREENVTKD